MLERGDSRKEINDRIQQAVNLNEFEAPAISDLSIQNLDLEETVHSIQSKLKEAL